MKKKKLIEVALPLEAINDASAMPLHEKSPFVTDIPRHFIYGGQDDRWQQQGLLYGHRLLMIRHLTPNSSRQMKLKMLNGKDYSGYLKNSLCGKIPITPMC